MFVDTNAACEMPSENLSLRDDDGVIAGLMIHVFVVVPVPTDSDEATVAKELQVSVARMVAVQAPLTMATVALEATTW